MVAPHKNSKKAFISAVVGTVLIALCCFTPVLVGVLGILGLGFLTHYLDYALLPAFLVMLIVTVMAYRKWQRAQGG
jgi:mercuric ion transport protein